MTPAEAWDAVDARAAQAGRLLATLKREGVGTRVRTRHYWLFEDLTAREHLADCVRCRTPRRPRRATPTDLLGRIQSGAASARRALQLEAAARTDLAAEAHSIERHALEAWTRAARHAREAADAQVEAWTALARTNTTTDDRTAT